jgi:hypothetical protein
VLFRSNGAFGTSIAGAGDVNGDGFGDVVIGAPDAQSRAGRAYVFLGGPSGMASAPATTLSGPDGMGGAFGNSVAAAGDVNGDGYSDVIVGAHGALELAGRAYVFLGGPSGLGATPAVNLTSPDGAGGTFGFAVAGAGDVNGDGFGDVVVGAQTAAARAGRAHLYLGGPSGLNATPTTDLESPDGVGALFGIALAGAGDVNGDGYPDVVVGASSAMSSVGRVHLFLGGARGLAAAPATSLTGGAGMYALFGWPVAAAGDINQDGFGDVVVGAPGADASSRTGRAFVYLGSAGGLVATPVASLTGPDGSAGLFGSAVGSAGDANGDGFGDLAVGALGVMSNTGRVYVYLGKADGLDPLPTSVLTGPDGRDGSFGRALARRERTGRVPDAREPACNARRASSPGARVTRRPARPQRFRPIAVR